MKPLISVIVLTYNSSEFVLETLESIKAQTYDRIEVIITDDASTDTTLEICREWLNINNTRFVGTQLIKSINNTGIPANCNRGVNASSGEWIKIIGGDDYLDCELFAKQMDCIKSNGDIKILWTNVALFYDTEEGRIFQEPDGVRELSINNENITCRQQFQIMLRFNPVYTGGLLINKEVFQSVGLFDESYPSFEDRPFLHRALLKQYKLYYLDIVGAFYRKHNASVQVRNNELLRNSHAIDRYRYEISISQYYTNRIERIFRFMNASYNLFYIKHISNTRNGINKCFLYGPTAFMDFIIGLFIKKYI